MEITRDISCRGCGEKGQAVWDEQSWHPDVQIQRIPLRVTGRFALLAKGADKVIACLRCQQILPPG
jgi:hypothetical protein